MSKCKAVDPECIKISFLRIFAEAYKYRRLQECFALSKYWQNYDVFFRQKVC